LNDFISFIKRAI